MNWKLIFQLSMLGLIMAFGTISLIPEKVEFIFWIAIFIIVAYMIAKVAPGKYFAYGFIVSVFNSVYLTIAHIVFFNSYLSHHSSQAEMIFYTSHDVILSMIIIGAASGIIFGLVQGLFAFVASKFVKPAPQV